MEVKCTSLKHRLPAYGYRVNEKDKPGQFNLEKAKKLNIPAGPIYGELHSGKTVELEDGRILNGSDFCGKPKKGESFVYCTDTIFSERAVELSKNVDLLVHEATFSEKDEEMAFEKLHSTTTMAAKTALLSNAKKLVLTHLSPRYTPKSSVTPIFFLFKRVLSIGQLIIPKIFVSNEILCAKLRQSFTNFDELFRGTLKGFL